ncbi:MAG: hypothetical protein IKW36_05350 [Alistipes sp.]|nr:hypothetical protein [Alistipes sp.]
MNYKTPPNVTITPSASSSTVNSGFFSGAKKFGASLLEAGLSLGSGFLSNFMAQDAAQEQREWLEAMWAKQNQYNSPIYQAALMRKAGLNPYAMTGMQPAGSVGSSPPANVTPINAGDPLSALKTIAEVDNIRAVTGKTETEEEKILKEISLIDIGVSHGLITYKEAQFMLNKLFEAYKDKNPYTLSANNTESGTEANKASAAASNAQAGLFAEQALTESELRELRKDSLIAGNDWTRTQQNIAEAMQPFEQAYKSAQTAEAKESALLRRQEALKVVVDKINAVKANNRAAALHTVQLQTAKYARDLGATESELAKINAEVSKLWYDEDRSDFANAVLDFIHSNVRLAGSASYSRK